MPDTLKKTVYIPLKVPIGSFCSTPSNSCGNFDESWGHPICTFGFQLGDRNKLDKVPKPKECSDLSRSI